MSKMPQGEATLKEILISENLVSQEDLSRVSQEKKKTGKSLTQILIKEGLVKEETLVSALAKQSGIPYIDLSEQEVDPVAVALVSEDTARKWTLLPIAFQNDHLVVVMSNPANTIVLDDLKIETGYEIKPAVNTKNNILEAINYYYRLSPQFKEELEESDVQPVKTEEIAKIVEDAPIVKLVDIIVSRAVEEYVSDIHIEPQEYDLRVRYRIDGVLQEIIRLPRRIQFAIISRFKIMAGLDVAENRKPQDGHCSLKVKGKAVDFRVATLPTVCGERVVLRILKKESILLGLADLGFFEEDLKKLESSYKQPYGTIFVTGPTGSGKSTTLYAILNVLNTMEKNIVTIEDPVEYRLKGLNQIQINPKAGLTFARALRAILRADPDIVMIGEIRDKETAQIAVEAALTGHLVLSTLHTNDAPGAITRLTEMGVEPFLTSSAINCVQAQRLARKLCQHCKESYYPKRETLENINFPFKEDGNPPKLCRAKGCKACGGTGYKGRIGLFEVMPVSERIEKLTVERTSAEEIKKVALAEGMSTLKQDGFKKVREGLTSIEEVLRVAV